MSDVIKVVEGDGLPNLNLTIKDSSTGDPSDPESWDPIDLSAGTTAINVLLRARNTDTLLATISCTKVDGGSTGKVTMSISDVASQAIGRYEGQIEIDYNGVTQTVPEELEFKVAESFN